MPLRLLHDWGRRSRPRRDVSAYGPNKGRILDRSDDWVSGVYRVYRPQTVISKPHSISAMTSFWRSYKGFLVQWIVAWTAELDVVGSIPLECRSFCFSVNFSGQNAKVVSIEKMSNSNVLATKNYVCSGDSLSH